LEKYTIINAGVHMGIALQYVNIARDISVDAYMNRVYIPTTWLLKENLKPTDVVAKPHGKKIYVLRRRILNRAFEMYEQAKPALEELPAEARRPLRVAVESYMEIGRVLKEGNYEAKCEMAQVSNWRRLGVAWKALKEG
jgi:15-cis-phytoene synthase/lycopene beta-cyclase